MSSPGPLAQWVAGLASTISHGDPAAVGIAVAVLAAGSGYCSWRTWRHVSHIRLVEDTPTAQNRSAPQGYVELEGNGKLMDGPPIIAKLSGLPCVWGSATKSKNWSRPLPAGAAVIAVGKLSTKAKAPRHSGSRTIPGAWSSTPRGRKSHRDTRTLGVPVLP